MYDPTKEKVLSEKDVPFWDNHPEWGGLVLMAVQYENKQPQIILRQYRIDKSNNERKVVPFISIPASSMVNISSKLLSLSAYIEQTYPRKPQE